jgi:hypothetical protein
MTTQRIAGGSIGLDREDDLREEQDHQALLTALKELVDRLSGLPSEAVERWEGDEFLYVETPLSQSAGAEIDVNIQGGRAFIRMAR